MDISHLEESRRDVYVTTSPGYVEILEFTHFARLFKFDTDEDNFKNKVHFDRIKVTIALKLS